MAHEVCATKVFGCIIAICAISLRRSVLPWMTLPWTENLVFWLLKLAVELWPPVFE